MKMVEYFLKHTKIEKQVLVIQNITNQEKLFQLLTN